MAYKHGTYGVYEKSIGSNAKQTDTIAVYVGVAPVHLTRGWKEKGVVNNPVRLDSLDSAQKKMGYVDVWGNYTLCEAFAAHFDNPIQSVGPIVAINVLDPDTHKKSSETTKEVTFVNGVAKIESTTVILDSIVLANLVEGVDFTIDYDFDKKVVNIYAVSSKATGSIQATYSEIDLTDVDADTIIGSKTDAGVYTGLGAIDLVYTETGFIPNIIAAPGFSQEPEVYKAMIKAANKANGHWDAFVNADIPIASVQTMAEAITWKSTNGYTEERSKAYYPKWKTNSGEIYHISTLATWLMVLVDSEHDGIPMETPSNKQIPSGKQYFGASSTNRGFDQQAANELNAKGITTAVYWGGINVLWGDHTAAYDYEAIGADNRSIFDNSIRTMYYVSNSFQEEHALTIDKPMTRAMADTIKIREQEKADALANLGALIGTPVVEFKEGENSTDELIQGNFTWSNKHTPTPPFKSGTLKIAYTDEGFNTYYTGGEQ